LTIRLQCIPGPVFLLPWDGFNPNAPVEPARLWWRTLAAGKSTHMAGSFVDEAIKNLSHVN
jgi:hypothetical protein